MERRKSDRQLKIKAKVMPNGNIRFYQDDSAKSGISELQIQNVNAVAMTLTTSGEPKILVRRI